MIDSLYWQMRDLDNAGLMAFKYTFIKPKREKELKERLEDIKNSYKAMKPRQEISERYFLKGLEYFKSGSILAKDHMEKSVEEYLKSENECRSRCEKPDPEFEYAPDIFSDLARNLNSNNSMITIFKSISSSHVSLQTIISSV